MRSVTQSLSVTYEAKPGVVAEARAAVAQFVASAGATETQLGDICLAVSEAVTNAVVHAYPGASGPVQVTVALAGTELWILVADEGAGMQPQADRPGLGLGLALISQVCDNMSIAPRASGGTEVRILFKLQVATQHQHQRQAAPAPEAASELALGARERLSCVPAAPLPD